MPLALVLSMPAKYTLKTYALSRCDDMRQEKVGLLNELAFGELPAISSMQRSEYCMQGLHNRAA